MEKVFGKVVAKKNMSNQSQQIKCDMLEEVKKRLKFLENDTEKVCTFVFQVEQNRIYTVKQLFIRAGENFRKIYKSIVVRNFYRCDLAFFLCCKNCLSPVKREKMSP